MHTEPQRPCTYPGWLTYKRNRKHCRLLKRLISLFCAWPHYVRTCNEILCQGSQVLFVLAFVAISIGTKLREHVRFDILVDFVSSIGHWNILQSISVLLQGQLTKDICSIGDWNKIQRQSILLHRQLINFFCTILLRNVCQITTCQLN